ncbi:hypothetical protein RIR_e4206_jg13876.t1 [Rhizophagus irregularis DAOM 181602=DAOM 197198]|nr:hypothetical protein RIR_e4206_jg13876.t1 [Rhizophagus irregularis DAOM 181602=DAOM 197198]
MAIPREKLYISEALKMKNLMY